MDLQHALETARDAARQAGEKLLSYYTSQYTIRHKSAGNPVTTADIEANHILRDALLGAFPDAGWLSEESSDNPERLEKEWVWIVDPLDGTREFIEGIDEFAVSVALVQGTAPVVAVTYNPPAASMTYCRRGSGVFSNGDPVRATDRPRLKRRQLRWPAGARPGGACSTASRARWRSGPPGASPTSSRWWPRDSPT